jgi:polyphenol oxidase
LVFARQVHGTTAALVGPEDRGRGTRSEADAVPDTDILVTVADGLTLVILVADCVPLALVDPEAGVLAAVHAGWRGTADGAVARALHVMEGRGARAERVRAFLGPAVHPDRYQVSDEVRRALSEAVRPAAPDPAVARPDGPGHWLVDLVAANRQQLREAGVRADHIVESGCTTADEALFSDRARRPCGRFALLARRLG